MVMGTKINKMKLIILDRDGVINKDSSDYIKSPEEWIPIPGSLEAISKLNKAGFTVIVITNQSVIERGYFTLETLDAMHKKMQTKLKKLNGHIDKIYFCPHKPEDNCDCRKPKTKMFEQLAHDYNIDLHNVINIGDSLRDMQAGKKMGVSRGTIWRLVKSGRKKVAVALTEGRTLSVGN